MPLPLQNFVPFVGPPASAAWLNQLDVFYHAFVDPPLTAVLSASGFTAGVNCNITYRILGKTALVNFGSTNGTSNSTAFVLNNLPAALLPATLDSYFPVYAIDNGTFTLAELLLIHAVNSLTIQKNGSSNGWTNAGAKSFGPSTLAWDLD